MTYRYQIFILEGPSETSASPLPLRKGRGQAPVSFLRFTKLTTTYFAYAKSLS